MTLARKPLSLTVNGEPLGPLDAPETISMADFLSEYLGLTGTRTGCGQGLCGACAIILEDQDGALKEMRACVMRAHWFAGRRVRTIEGIAGRTPLGAPTLSPLQQAFIDHFAFQCGYCTPGFVMAATVFMDGLRRAPIARGDLEAAITHALDGHLCRCTGYVRYFEAVRDTALATPGLVRV